METKREIWKLKGVRRQILVVRNKGRLVTWSKVKGKTKREVKDLKSKVKQSKSFKQDIKEVITYKNGNKEVIYTQQPKGKQARTQIYAVVDFAKVLPSGRLSKVTESFFGVSSFNNKGIKGKKQAFNNAVNQAVSSGFATYDKIVAVKVEYEYHAWKMRGETYVREQLRTLNKATA